ncbi:hypothetical protein AGMMS49974_12210 [Deltaproteobacteria bacterium]|nr:hypothetical protein AGMMS49974_12210 [Deltaproteobacteria bacterium]
MGGLSCFSSSISCFSSKDQPPVFSRSPISESPDELSSSLFVSDGEFNEDEDDNDDEEDDEDELGDKIKLFRFELLEV